MVLYPWKRAAALTALVVATINVGWTTVNVATEKGNVVMPSSAASQDDRGMGAVAVDSSADHHPLRQQRRSLKKSLETLFQPAAADNSNSKLEATPRIVGGTVAPNNPSYAFNAGDGLCGGTLIHPEYVCYLLND